MVSALCYSGGFNYSPEKSYPGIVAGRIADQVKNKKTEVKAIPRALCIARVQDICTFIDKDSCKPDDFFNELTHWMMRGTLDSAEEANQTRKSVEYAWGMFIQDPEDPSKWLFNADTWAKENFGTQGGYPSLEAINADYLANVKNADFITLSAGGNNFYSYAIFSGISNWYINSDGSITMQPGTGAQKVLNTNLEDWFDAKVVKVWNVAKAAAIAEAKLVDYANQKSGLKFTLPPELLQLAGAVAFDLSTAESSVRSVFNFLEVYLYTIAAYKQSVPKLLDLIHENNPDAKIAVTAIPYAYTNYRLKISDNLSISLRTMVKPLYDLINKEIEKAADERSDYVRYIDVPEPELITVMTSDKLNGALVERYPGKTLDIAEFIDLVLGPAEATHLSENGHEQIAAEIMKNFNFDCTAEDKPAGLRGFIENLWNTLIKGEGNIFVRFYERIKTVNFWGLLR